jgi:ABC-type polysaccharide/polyol phosphate export permease
MQAGASGIRNVWSADYPFVLQNLVLKDFKLRYRNMSLGVFWSLLNPFIMMGVLVFVFTMVFPNRMIRGFPLFVLCGLIPFNFFTAAWSGGMVSVTDNSGLVKRVPLPRILLPVASVLANCIHVVIQIGILLAFALALGFGVNWNWLWLPVVWFFEILFLLGLVMATSALDVYVRDLRYIVDSVIRVMFWLVPVFYSLDNVPRRYRGFYEFNPISALTLTLRQILMESAAPDTGLLLKLATSSLAMLVAGWLIFRSLQGRFFEQL